MKCLAMKSCDTLFGWWLSKDSQHSRLVKVDLKNLCWNFRPQWNQRIWLILLVSEPHLNLFQNPHQTPMKWQHLIWIVWIFLLFSLLKLRVRDYRQGVGTARVQLMGISLIPHRAQKMVSAAACIPKDMPLLRLPALAVCLRFWERRGLPPPSKKGWEFHQEERKLFFLTKYL